MYVCNIYICIIIVYMACNYLSTTYRVPQQVEVVALNAHGECPRRLSHGVYIFIPIFKDVPLKKNVKK